MAQEQPEQIEERANPRITHRSFERTQGTGSTCPSEKSGHLDVRSATTARCLRLPSVVGAQVAGCYGLHIDMHQKRALQASCANLCDQGIRLDATEASAVTVTATGCIKIAHL